MIQSVIEFIATSIDRSQYQVLNPAEIALAELLESSRLGLGRRSVFNLPFFAARGFLQRGENLVLGNSNVIDKNELVGGEGRIFERGSDRGADGGEECGGYGIIAVIIYGRLVGFEIEPNKR